MSCSCMLRHLECIHKTDPTGLEYYGCDQNWYQSDWQRLSGCGPTTASTLLRYLQQTGRIALPVEGGGQQECRLLMEAVWEHVTPTRNGIYNIEQFCRGIGSFAGEHGLLLVCHSLEIGRSPAEKPSLADIFAFIAEGIGKDCPIGFLNLDNGDVANLEGWHWVTIVGLEADDELASVRVTVFDGDSAEEIDLRQWHETTDEGGALIYLEYNDTAV